MEAVIVTKVKYGEQVGRKPVGGTVMGQEEQTVDQQLGRAEFRVK